MLTTYKQYLAYYLAEFYHDKKKLGFWFRLCKKYDSEDILLIHDLTQSIIKNSKKEVKNPVGLFLKLFFEYQKKNKAKPSRDPELKKAVQLDN